MNPKGFNFAFYFLLIVGIFGAGACEKRLGIVEREGLSVEERVKLGMIYYQEGEVALAQRQFAQAVLEDKGNPEAWFGLGLCQHALSDYQQSVRSFQNVILLKPDYAEAYNNLADGYLKLGRLRDAEQAIKEAIKLGGENLGYFHLTYSEVLLARGQMESGCQELNRARDFSAEDEILISAIKNLWEKNCNGR